MMVGLTDVQKFLSTPSARRATNVNDWHPTENKISIHALREEGDLMALPSLSRMAYFYPRPPRGGRLYIIRNNHIPDLISIHALREEGDLKQVARTTKKVEFLSTPSARRATDATREGDTVQVIFLSTPSARRATSPS